jgi:hypothetical protein
MSFDVRTRISMLKASAKARGININLDLNKYQNYIDLGCFYCGCSLENEKGYCLDRTDSSKGYTITNVVACCKLCNRAKMNLGIWEFASWVKRVSDHTLPRLEKVKQQFRDGEEVLPSDEYNEHERLAKEKGYNFGRLKMVNTDNDN